MGDQEGGAKRRAKKAPPRIDPRIDDFPVFLDFGAHSDAMMPTGSDVFNCKYY